MVKPLIKNTALYGLLCLISAIVLFPLLVTATNSFMSAFEITNRYAAEYTAYHVSGLSGGINIHYAEISLIPSSVTLRQYLNMLFGSPLYLGLFWNSVSIALPVVAGQLLISVPAAYAFELSRFRYKEVIFFIYIVFMLMPLQVTLVPNYLVAEFLRINDSRLAVILPGIANPFGVFLIRQSLKALPREYIEAAKMDGAGHARIVARIVAPIIRPAVTALVILTFVEYWNVVEQAVVFIKSSYNEPLSVYLSRLSKNDPGVIFAASCFYLLPPLLVFLYGHDEMAVGIQLSGIK